MKNLLTPGDVGMTFLGTINTTIPNSSPIFQHECAAFTFVGDDLHFDASATDADGDQLVYSLDDPLDGASSAEPIPNPPGPPPYQLVPWLIPYYKYDMLGGPAPLTIDSTTGLITAIPGNIGVFLIAYKIEEYRNGVLINTHRKEFVIVVNPAQYFDASGMVYALNGTQPLDVGDAWLIRLNLIDSTLTAEDTNSVINGYYLHPQAINSEYLIKASADAGSAYFADHIPTYYGNVLFWYQASPVFLCDSNVSGIDIDLLPGLNPGGPGFIGGLISQGANRMSSPSTGLSGITVILFDQNNQPMGYDITDAGGVFGIGNLPFGTYKVYIDRLNYIVDNTIAPQITINSANPTPANLAFQLHTTWLELIGYVGISVPPVTAESLDVFPNPSTGPFNFVMKGSGRISELNIYDIAGRLMHSGNSTTIDLRYHNPGVYFYKVITESGSILMGKIVVLK